MAMSKIGDGKFRLTKDESWVMCPYNSCHLVTNLKIGMHVSKCRRNYVKELEGSGQLVDYATCRYNYTHKMPTPEVGWHQELCQDRQNVFPLLLPTNPRREAVELTSGEKPKYRVPLGEEDWEALPPVKSYDPRIVLEMTHPCYTPPNMTRSERRELRRANNERREALAQEQNQQPKPSTSAQACRFPLLSEMIMRTNAKPLNCSGDHWIQGRTPWTTLDITV